MANKTNPAEQNPLTEEEKKDIIARAKKGDPTTLPQLVKLLEDPLLVQQFGDLAFSAERSFIEKIAGNDLLAREALIRNQKLYRKDLNERSETLLERMLVHRVVACWLQVQDAENRYAQRQDKLSIAKSKFYLLRIDRAHQRHLSATKALAVVRKLAVPVLQVNVAKKQINVANQTIASTDVDPKTASSGEP